MEARLFSVVVLFLHLELERPSSLTFSEHLFNLTSPSGPSLSYLCGIITAGLNMPYSSFKYPLKASE